MRVASFFAGVGGIDLGFLQAGFDVIWANEILQSKSQSLEWNAINNCNFCRSIFPYNKERSKKHEPKDLRCACTGAYL